MSRFSRHPSARPFGARGTPRLWTSLIMLAIVGLVYFQARNPNNWRWLTADDAADPQAAHATKNPSPRWKETLISAQNDQDSEELAAGRMQLDAVIDKRPLEKLDMPAYWRLLKWARSQSFEELEGRAKRDVVYAQLFQRPEKYRGQLIRLRLHVRRIVKGDDVPANTADAEDIFELWGSTDESKSQPYGVICPEMPDWFRTGGDVEEECVFVGYFFKLMAHDALNTQRASPVLIGRLRPISIPTSTKRTPARTSTLDILVVTSVLGILAFGIWRLITIRRRAQRAVGASSQREDVIESWLCEPSTGGEFAVPASVAVTNPMAESTASSAMNSQESGTSEFGTDRPDGCS
jgi:hypothetical protein